MKGIVFTRYGSPDVLELRDVDTPVPKPDEVLIRVHAASVNDWDWQALHGIPFVNRLIFGLLKPRPTRRILGCDVAGQVESVGADVRNLRPGDEVYGDLSLCGFGTFAEYVCAREDALIRKPLTMTFEEAAAIPQAGVLAASGLRDSGNIRSGQTILINGAGGGVGTFAIQIARLYDVEVTGVDAPGKLDMLRSMGFDHVVDYTRDDFTRSGRRYDLILDVKTNRSVIDCMRALNPDGVYVTIGGTTGRLVQALLLWPLTSMASRRKVRIGGGRNARANLSYVHNLFEKGKLRPVIDGPYALADVPAALRYFGEGRHKGKIIITMK